MSNSSTSGPRFAAVLFDMDGTLLDSEPLTERAVAEVMDRYGVGQTERSNVDLPALHGVTWRRIVELLFAASPELAASAGANDVEKQLRDSFFDGLCTESPRAIAGSVHAVRAASAHHAVALVTSSDRVSADHVIGGLDLLDVLQLRVCAEDVTRSKPDPQGYLKAAAQLGTAPHQCLVFEDSTAGLRAAKAAGMGAIAIAGRSHDEAADHARRQTLAAIADRVITDFTELDADFFAEAVLP